VRGLERCCEMCIRSPGKYARVLLAASAQGRGRERLTGFLSDLGASD
jgi:hypothetical protein